MAVFAAIWAPGANAEAPTDSPTAKPGYFPQACSRVSADPAVRNLHEGDSWRYSSAYEFPFNGWTSRGQSRVIWGLIKNSARKAPYPAPNLPSCRVGRFGTEDRAAHKAGKFFPMLEPIDGERFYMFKDSFGRHIASLDWKERSSAGSGSAKWGWYIDGAWAGHDATRAFEFQSRACKLKPELVDGSWRWVRDPGYVMVSFAPNLGKPGKGYAPKNAIDLRVRAFLDRRAIPPAILAQHDKYDFGCGSTTLPAMRAPKVFQSGVFFSGFGGDRAYLKDYYFGELPTTLKALPGESRVSNTYRMSVYNPRPHYGNATYLMTSTTGVAGGGMVRAIALNGVDTFTKFDEIRYCDPNYTLRNMQLRKGKKRYKKSQYFAPYTYSAKNRPSVRWVYGRIDPSLDPETLSPFALEASQNPASIAVYGWSPINCDR